MSGCSIRVAAAAPWLLCAGLAGALAACGGDPVPAAPPPAASEPGPDAPLLVVDGVTITFGEVAPYVAWLDGLNPEYSRRTKLRKVLDELVLPLRFAQREFGAGRATQLAQARALRASAGNVVELEQLSAQRQHLRKTVNPSQVELPIARFLFDPLQVGAVSEPIELPQGFLVAGLHDLERAGMPIADRADALQVPFFTHGAADFKDWLTALQRRLAGKVTYAHPDFREAIPGWLQLP